MEVRFGIAPPALRRRLARAVLRLDALHRGPGFDQRAIDREVIARQKLLYLGLRQHRREELGRDVAFQQPVAVLREHRMVPGCDVDADTDEPAEQQIVFQPLHQKPLRADRIKRLQQHRPQQLLRRYRRPPNRRIEPGKLALQRRQRLVYNRPDRSQRMISPHPRLQVNVAEQLARSIVAAAHAPSPNLVGANESRSPVGGECLFQQPARERQQTQALR